MTTLDRTLDRIRAYAAYHKWRPARFAIKAGLTPNALRDFNTPGWNPRTDTLRRLEAIIPADFHAPVETDETAAAAEGAWRRRKGSTTKP
ncbi:MAG: hypothetical protein HY057_12220 [Rhodospirillales bacterium]|nr:hypothetical protein [Rhodospirillales bacterium]